ncbi:MAG: HD domain-containing protein [Ignavibacteria bacterium]|nr:HD domain-containing protein [Ignavibacteria bacterium]
MNINFYKSSDASIDNLLQMIGKFADEQNFSVYVVGGYIRDRILCREKREVDFLVIGDGVRFAELLSSHLQTREITVYRNFGTALIYYLDYKLEFVGARKESYFSNSRKPSVQNGSFEDDIRRRDFTVNSIAFSVNQNDFGEIVDTFNGLADIDKKIIRTPLDPEVTFSDDPLRIMRAFRFSSQLNFTVEDSLLNAASKMSERLKIVSPERIVEEFLKIMQSVKPSTGLALMYKTGVMKTLYPEIAAMAGVDQKKDFHHKDVFWHTLQVVDNVAEVTNDEWLRIAALFHDIAKPITKKYDEQSGWSFHGHEEIGARLIKKIFKKYKFPLHKVDYIEKLTKLHLRPISLVDEEVTDSAIRRLIVAAGDDLEDLILMCRADITSKNPDKVKEYTSNYDLVVQKIHSVNERDKLRAFQSPVRGEEIMEMFQLPPCKGVGIIKTEVEEAILDGEIENTYEGAKEYLNQNFLRLSKSVAEFRNINT